MFKDRKDAGEKLSKQLIQFKDKDVIIIGIPRGGAIVARYVSLGLGKPMDVVIPRKIGAPFNKEVAIGALAQDGSVYLNDELIKYFKIPDSYIQEEARIQQEEIKRRLALYRGNNEFPDVKNKIVILVDDGIATGYTVFASINSLKSHDAKEIVVATPTAPAVVVDMLKGFCNKVVCLEMPEPFISVGSSYMVFEQNSDDEVIELFKQYNSKKFI